MMRRISHWLMCLALLALAWPSLALAQDGDTLAKSKRLAQHYRHAIAELLQPLVGEARITCVPELDGEGELARLRVVVVCAREICEKLGDDATPGTEIVQDLICAGFGVESDCCRVAAVPAKALKKAAEDDPVPWWARQVPSEPGRAFYAVGHSERSLEDAEIKAYVAVARTFKITVASAGGAQACATEFELSGCEVIKHAVVNTPDGPEYWALARIGFDDVAHRLQRQPPKPAERVREDAAKAFEELDKLLAEEKAKDKTPKDGQPK